MPSEGEPRVLILNPGDFAFGGQETLLQTLLGSCVAITFWHPGWRIGAMCHYMLPSRPPNRSGILSGRYAEEALEAIDDRFRALGLAPESIQTRMFGGANMFPGLTGKQPSIGDRNIEAGRSLLKSMGFALTQEDLGGCLHRRVSFLVGTGRVEVQYGESGPKAAGGRR